MINMTHRNMYKNSQKAYIISAVILPLERIFLISSNKNPSRFKPKNELEINQTSCKSNVLNTRSGSWTPPISGSSCKHNIEVNICSVVMRSVLFCCKVIYIYLILLTFKSLDRHNEIWIVAFFFQ